MNTFISPLSGAPSPLAANNAPFLLQWRELEPLPDPVGLKGAYSGTHAGHVLLAGGSNFPVPASAGGRKAIHRAIYVRPLPLSANAGWRSGGELPQPLAEGATIALPEGILCVGGHDGTAPAKTVLLMRWNAAADQVETIAWPELPTGATSVAAALHDGSIYVAGGETRTGTADIFWRLDLEAARRAPGGVRWEPLPTWPGRPRLGCILAPVTTPGGARLLLAGGVQAPAKSQQDYHRDAFLYDPATRRWERAATMPRGAVLAGVIQPTAGQVLVLGGSDGHDFARMKELGDRYRIPDDVLLYDGKSDCWQTVGRMPVGVVAPAIAALDGAWLIAGGEYSPGLRTAQAFLLQLAPRTGE